jgi:TfoX N-terminal domain
MAYDEELAARIRDLVGDEADLTEKKMFGGLAFLVGGNMAVAASGQGGLLVRVDPRGVDEAGAGHASAPNGDARSGDEGLAPRGCGRSADEEAALHVGPPRRRVRAFAAREELARRSGRNAARGQAALVV